MLLRNRLRLFESLLVAVLLTLAPGAGFAAVLAGDLDGDGSITANDETLLTQCFDSESGYDPSADLDADGKNTVADLAIFGANFARTGGDVDVTPPSLLVTLNDIPDDMNDLLVVPPDRFEITLLYDAGGHSVVDPASLSVISDHDIGPHPAGSELASYFDVTPTRAAWEVPEGSDLARTSHALSVSLRDVAGNAVAASFGFAVRDFQWNAPLAQPQTIFLDFDQDRSLGPEIDFIESLRVYGLSSATQPAIEAGMRTMMVNEITLRVQAYYAKGVDSANITFVSEAPAGTYSRICIGGESPQGASILGAASLDLHNISKSTDECALAAQFGIFPHALDNLWGNDPDMQQAFAAVDPSFGGTRFGEHPLDPIIGSPDFNILKGTASELERFIEILYAADAFAQAIATATAHEVGHMVGLTAPGPAPAGLWGGTTGARATHNVTVSGGTPSSNYLMNAGGSFSFGSLTGRGGHPLPEFRALNWAYLRGRITLNDEVTSLIPPPVLDAVQPSVVSFPPGTQSQSVTFVGSGFSAPVAIELISEGDPTPNEVLDVVVIDAETATGAINKFFVSAATYDVHFINADGQDTTLTAGLVVQ